MVFKTVELVNVPKPHNHIVEIAKVKQIASKELQIGDLILFGFHLLLIENLEYIPETTYTTMFKMKSLNLATGDSGSIGYPINSVFHRVIEAEITEMEQMEAQRWYGWKRLRKPILGEIQICGACGGDCGAITQEDIDRFEQELENNDCRHGALQSCYHPALDIFQSYDYCEEEISR